MRTLPVIASRFCRCRAYKWLRQDWGNPGAGVVQGLFLYRHRGKGTDTGLRLVRAAALAGLILGHGDDAHKKVSHPRRKAEYAADMHTGPAEADETGEDKT